MQGLDLPLDPSWFTHVFQMNQENELNDLLYGTLSVIEDTYTFNTLCSLLNISFLSSCKETGYDKFLFLNQGMLLHYYIGKVCI